MIKVRFNEDGELPDIEKREIMEDYEKAVDELCEELNWSLKKFVKAMAVCFNEKKMLQVDTPIEVLNLTQRSYNCLKRAKINTVEELIKRSRGDLLKIRNLGKRSFNEIQSELESYGLKLMGDKQWKKNIEN